MLCGVEIVNTLTSAAACKSIPRFKGLSDEGSGVVARRLHSPPFQGGVAAPSIRRSRSLAAQTGWFVISNKIRVATRAYKEATRLFTNHPGRCAATPPLKGGECHRFRNCLPHAITRTQTFMRTTSTHFATCRTVLITNQFSIFIRRPIALPRDLLSDIFRLSVFKP